MNSGESILETAFRYTGGDDDLWWSDSDEITLGGYDTNSSSDSEEIPYVEFKTGLDTKILNREYFGGTEPLNMYGEKQLEMDDASIEKKIGTDEVSSLLSPVESDMLTSPSSSSFLSPISTRISNTNLDPITDSISDEVLLDSNVLTAEKLELSKPIKLPDLKVFSEELKKYLAQLAKLKITF